MRQRASATTKTRGLYQSAPMLSMPAQQNTWHQLQQGHRQSTPASLQQAETSILGRS